MRRCPQNPQLGLARKGFETAFWTETWKIIEIIKKKTTFFCQNWGIKPNLIWFDGITIFRKKAIIHF